MPVNRNKETKHFIHRSMVRSGISIPQKAVEAIKAEDDAFDELDRIEVEQNANAEPESTAE